MPTTEKQQQPHFQQQQQQQHHRAQLNVQNTGKSPAVKLQKRSIILSTVDKFQLHFSLTVLLGLAALCFIPSTAQFGRKFFIVEGKIGAGTYDVHHNDSYFVFMNIIAIIFIRVFFMDFVFQPFCSNVLNMKAKNAKQRFAEQGWAFVIYSSSFLWGFKLMYTSSYFNNFDNLYKDFPHFMTREAKTYYLIEMANWISQVFILHIEKQRKDHYQMFAHHIITILLVYGSYVNHFTRIGNVILVIMDFVDIWLALAKILRYCGLTNACDFTFLIFFFSWIALRHGLYNYLIYFTYTKIFDLLEDSFCLDGAKVGMIIGAANGCISKTLVYSFLVLLVGLQIITIIWMFLILKVLYKILTGSNAEDVRSDSEDEGEEEEEEQEQEKEEGVEEIVTDEQDSEIVTKKEQVNENIKET